MPVPGRASVPLFPPLEDRPGYRPSRPVAPLPPIPGRDAPSAGATRMVPSSARERRAARRAARTPGRRRLIRVGVALCALLGVVLGYYLGLYFHVDQSIDRVAALTPEGPEVLAPQLQAESATYLVVGTGLPGAEGPAGVATLLVHVTADEDRAVLLSVPPTALVDTPACVGSDGAVREPTSEAFASALLDGGPACLVRTVQQMSGLRVDHYLGVDLARLPDMVDALGGVGVCLPVVPPAGAVAAEPLGAGPSLLSGGQAGGYLRPADPAADPTGAAVAERAQLLLTSTLRAAMSAGTLGDPVTLAKFLTAASDALTVDESTNLGHLRTLAGSLGGLSGSAVQRAALPVSQLGYVPAGSEQAYVLLDSAATRSLFDRVIQDGTLPEELLARPAAAGEDSSAADPAPAPAPQGPTVAPSEVTVDVLNGTATRGLAATAADLLRAQGFAIGEVGNELGPVTGTVVRHAPGLAEPARTVAAAVPGAVLEESAAVAGVQLVLGPGFAEVVPVVVVPPAPAPVEPASVGSLAAPAPQPAASSAPVSC